MSIRSKLAITFILLLIFGITAISSYSILFIRNYLLEEGERQIESDARWLAITFQNLPTDDRFETHLNEAAVISGYRIAVYDSDGYLYASVPYDQEVLVPDYLSSNLKDQLDLIDPLLIENRPDSDWLVAFTSVLRQDGEINYLHVSQLKEQIYAPIRTIRWIIYTGMFISIGLVLLVSLLFARYMSRPIKQLEQTALSIAEGDVNKTLHLNRNDEFGTLAESLNRMASRLREDNEKLKRLYERQGQFFADITHELRNPLHTISGALEMMQMKDIDPDQQKQYLQTASRQTERIHHLFKDLMTLQRFESDEHFIEKRAFNISDTLLHVHALYESAARDKGLELQVATSARPLIAWADPNKIEQVIENLVSNAIKYTNDGWVRISCEEHSGRVKISVKDTGIGIASEHLGRLFDRFYRTDKARSRDKGGTGLGLAVVHGILNAHDTTIDVESRVGEGSTFWFTLPLDQSGA